jgi:hypothetical protein
MLEGEVSTGLDERESMFMMNIGRVTAVTPGGDCGHGANAAKSSISILQGKIHSVGKQK